MRVWLLTSGPSEETADGVARYVGCYAPLLGEAGHEVLVISRGEEPGDEEMSPGVRRVRFEPRHAEIEAESLSGRPDDHPAYPYNVLSFRNALSFEFADVVLGLAKEMSPPDIIESEECGGLPYYLLQRKLTEKTPLKDVPLLVHMHGPGFEIRRVDRQPSYGFPEYWLDEMEKFCIVAADGLLSPDRSLADSVEETLERALAVTTIPYPLPQRESDPPVEGRQREVVYLGRLHPRNGVLTLVQCCDRLWSRGEAFRLTLVGDDADFAPLGCKVGEHIQRQYGRWIKDGRLILTGRLEPDDARQRLREAWVAVIPSRWESFPHRCVEALCRGQLVLASSTGGLAGLLQHNGANGFLFDWERDGDFEENLLRVFSLSPEERYRIIRNGQQRVRECCAPEVVLPQRIRHYQELIRKRAPRRSFPTVEPVAGAPRPVTSVGDGKGQAGLLSAIVRYPNPEAQIEEALDSILVSTFSPLEVLLFSDGDASPESLHALDRIGERGLAQVRIVQAPHEGSTTTRNSLVQQSLGEYIAFLDANDLVEPEFFERAVAVLKQYENVGFVYSWLRYFDAVEDIRPTWNAQFPYLLGHNMVCGPSVVRRKSLSYVGRDEPRLPCDLQHYASWIRLTRAGSVGVSLPHVLVRRRVRQAAGKRTEDACPLPHGPLTQIHEDLYRKWGVELFNLQNQNGPARCWVHPAKRASKNPEPWAAHQSEVAGLIERRDRLRKEVLRLGSLMDGLNHNGWLRFAARHGLFEYPE